MSEGLEDTDLLKGTSEETRKKTELGAHHAVGTDSGLISMDAATSDKDGKTKLITTTFIGGGVTTSVEKSSETVAEKVGTKKEDTACTAIIGHGCVHTDSGDDSTIETIRYVKGVYHSNLNAWIATDTGG